MVGTLNLHSSHPIGQVLNDLALFWCCFIVDIRPILFPLVIKGVGPNELAPCRRWDRFLW